MELRPIRTETDYQEALREIELLFNAAPNTPEYDRLDVLSTLVEAYENKHIAIAQLKTLPVSEQDADMENDRIWNTKFESTTDEQWDYLAKMVRQEISAGDITSLTDVFPFQSEP